MVDKFVKQKLCKKNYGKQLMVYLLFIEYAQLREVGKDSGNLAVNIRNIPREVPYNRLTIYPNR